MINYSTNWMGPINPNWLKTHGKGWAAGRIDIRVNEDDPYGSEIGLPIMSVEDWNRFSVWLRGFTTEEVYTLKQLVSEYEENNPKITWFVYE